MAALNTVFVLNGPNLNLLGTREPDIYGRETLGDIERRVRERAKAHALNVVFRQSNAEAEIIGWIHEARVQAKAVIINGGALTHTSIAILDALKAFDGPIIEVHLSNIYRREAFRHQSFISQAASGVICGLGPFGYEVAVDAVARLIRS
ncbi:MAG: type II 3-dehydroquinate dehydratase [Alphaproteobacteria bacterium]|nr:type II 3-dehydroquinate dehydratase [Alphaproteobacteria bacterium]